MSIGRYLILGPLLIVAHKLLHHHKISVCILLSISFIRYLFIIILVGNMS